MSEREALAVAQANIPEGHGVLITGAHRLDQLLPGDIVLSYRPGRNGRGGYASSVTVARYTPLDDPYFVNA